MTRKQTRLSLILAALALLGLAVGLVSYAFRSNIQFFCTPTDFSEKGNCFDAAQAGRRLRLGGMVKHGSVVKGENFDRDFVMTDTIHETKVSYHGKDPLPALFDEDKGAVAEGALQPDGTFLADVVLAKHDEKYMPKDLMDKLKARGVKLGQSSEQ